MSKSNINRILLFVVLFSLTGCAYTGNFNCPNSKGARCMMLSEVDSQVSSGEIEKVYQKKRCFGKSCTEESKPELQNGKMVKARLVDDDKNTEYEGEEYLYVK